MKRISFSDDMMRAISAGEKTMTRRKMPRQPFYAPKSMGGGRIIPKESYSVGDLVAATCAWCSFDDWIEYRFNSPNDREWEPGRIMKADDAPYVLRITSVRHEPLLWVSDGDAEREGMLHWSRNLRGYAEGWQPACPAILFHEYWDKLYGKGAFVRDSGLLVWVYGFEMVERRIDG